jgi:hypothetical protein
MTVFAHESLFDAIKAHFDTLLATAPTVEVPTPPVQNVVPVVWGRNEPPKQTNIGTRGRICFVPNAPDGSIGAVDAPEQPGRDPKPLYSQERKFTIYIFGRDPAQPNVPRAQDHTVELIFHEVCRAIYLSTHLWGEQQVTSPVVLAEPAVLRPEAQHPFGVEYRFPGTVQSAIVDQYDDFSEWVDATPLNAETTQSIGDTERIFETEAD